jgi:hypothetical protein
MPNIAFNMRTQVGITGEIPRHYASRRPRARRPRSNRRAFPRPPRDRAPRHRLHRRQLDGFVDPCPHHDASSPGPNRRTGPARHHRRACTTAPASSFRTDRHQPRNHGSSGRRATEKIGAAPSCGPSGIITRARYGFKLKPIPPVNALCVNPMGEFAFALPRLPMKPPSIQTGKFLLNVYAKPI